MPVSTTAASPWPRNFAFAAAVVLSGASGSINVQYGFSKGDTLAGSLTWAAVAGAVAVILALSVPALIRSIEARRWSAALMAGLALLLSATFSITAALGSASGARTNAASAELATTDARARAQAAHDRAQAELDGLIAAKPASELQGLIEATKAELAKLPAGRSVAELEAAINAARRDPWRYGCAAVNGSLAVSCPKLDGELARARNRERMAAKLTGLVEDAGKATDRVTEQRAVARTALDRAAAELAGLRPAKVANSDAVALARYLTALGADITPQRLNDLLVLLSVLMLELGGSAAIAIGMALTGPVASTDQPRPATTNTPAELARTVRTPAPAVAAVQLLQPSVTAARLSGSDIIGCLQASGGQIEGVRRLAVRVGRPRSTVSDECHRLAAAGQVTLTRGPKGMVLALAARPN